MIFFVKDRVITADSRCEDAQLARVTAEWDTGTLQLVPRAPLNRTGYRWIFHCRPGRVLTSIERVRDYRIQRYWLVTDESLKELTPEEALLTFKSDFAEEKK